MVVAKKFILVDYFEGEPKSTDLKIINEELPPLKNGEILVEAEYLSVDPYMRLYIKQLPLNSTMFGVQLAMIVESKNANYPVGKRIVGHLGWRTHTVININDFDENSLMVIKPELLPDIGNLPVSLALGALGFIGHTAYLGLMEICKPKAGETLVVSGAGGAVGSHVGQIGKILGLKVIGIAGSDEKCKWITSDLGFDHAINYKTQDVAAELKKVAPQGVDCYFDNVGGEISSAVIYQMNPYGRVSVCGSISAYNSSPEDLPKCTITQPALVMQQLKVEGFLLLRWKDRFIEAFEKNLQWIHEGKLVYRETVTEGFENMFNAFLHMLRGENIGKAIVKV